MKTTCFVRSWCCVHAILAAILLGPSLLHAEPEWWATRSVIDPNLSAEDYSPATIGQLKWIATQGAEELDAFLPGGSGTAVNSLVNKWSTRNLSGVRTPVVSGTTDDFALLNLGQVKNSAKPFFDRLAAFGLTSGYPWLVSGTNDYSVANIGQLKRAFSFGQDNDEDGIADLTEIGLYGNLTTVGGFDANGSPIDQDQDGLTDSEEVAVSLNPFTSDATVHLYDASGNLKAVSGNSEDRVFVYDASGNLLSSQ